MSQTRPKNSNTAFLTAPLWKNRADEGKGRVLRPHAGIWAAGQIYGDDRGICDVVGFAQQLAGQLGSALPMAMAP